MPHLLSPPWFAQRPIVERSRHIAAVLASHGLGSVLDATGLSRFLRWHHRRGVPPEPVHTQAEHLRMALGELGATFTKLGQTLSTRADLLPPEFVRELSRLQDSAPPVPFEHVEQTIVEDFGAGPDALFATFDRHPIASASIGQVHAATLPNGAPVVVKVRRPGVADEVERDLAILSGMARWVRDHTEFGADYDVMSVVEEFAFTIRNELDYVREGQNADRFRREFADDPTLLVPFVFWDRTTTRVLTMERMTGIKISNLEALDQQGIPRRAVAENAVRFFLKQVLEMGLFHADSHPGNFFVQAGGRIALVDFGMVGRVSESVRVHLMRGGLAALRYDSEALAEELYALGVAGEKAEHRAFIRDLDHVLGRYAGATVSDVSAARVVDELNTLAFRHKLQLPSELALLFRVLVMSEGIGLMLDPGFHFLEYASPLIRQSWDRRHSLGTALDRAGRAAVEAFELGTQLPGRASRLLGRAERGQLDFNVRHEGLDPVVREFQKMTNRLALAIIVGSAIVALGLAITLYEPVRWISRAGWLFTGAFLAALVLAGWLIFGLWRSKTR